MTRSMVLTSTLCLQRAADVCLMSQVSGVIGDANTEVINVMTRELEVGVTEERRAL